MTHRSRSLLCASPISLSLLTVWLASLSAAIAQTPPKFFDLGTLRSGRRSRRRRVPERSSSAGWRSAVIRSGKIWPTRLRGAAGNISQIAEPGAGTESRQCRRDGHRQLSGRGGRQSLRASQRSLRRARAIRSRPACREPGAPGRQRHRNIRRRRGAFHQAPGALEGNIAEAPQGRDAVEQRRPRHVAAL